MLKQGRFSVGIDSCQNAVARCCTIVLAMLVMCALSAAQLPDSEESADSVSDVDRDPKAALELAIDQAHADLFKHDCFPSAKKCATCHPQHFRE